MRPENCAKGRTVWGWTRSAVTARGGGGGTWAAPWEWKAKKAAPATRAAMAAAPRNVCFFKKLGPPMAWPTNFSGCTRSAILVMTSPNSVTPSTHMGLEVGLQGHYVVSGTKFLGGSYAGRSA